LAAGLKPNLHRSAERPPEHRQRARLDHGTRPASRTWTGVWTVSGAIGQPSPAAPTPSAASFCATPSAPDNASVAGVGIESAALPLLL